MSELKESKTPELDRCLNAIYLELPEAVARDVNRIVRAALADAADEAREEAAQVCDVVADEFPGGSPERLGAKACAITIRSSKEEKGDAQTR